MTVMLLEWVFTSIFLILVVLALRAALGRRMSARLRYALWAVVLVRLLVPVQLFTSPIVGTRVFTEAHTKQTVIQRPAADSAHTPARPDDELSLSLPNGTAAAFPAAPQAPAAPAAPIVPEPPAAPDLTKAPSWLGWAWLAGGVAVALVLLLSNLRFFWKLRQARIPLETADCPLRVYVTVDLPSPCLFGVLRPAVYVTPEAAANPVMLRHVLAHEVTHFRHADHLWSLLRCAALAAHWWNPLVWLAAALSRRDGELACDEGALKRLGDGERRAYGSTLLALVTAKPVPGDLLCFATTMAGNKKSLRERFGRIACAPKRILWAAVAAVLTVSLACLCAFGQAQPEADDPVSSADPTVSAQPVQKSEDLEQLLTHFKADVEDVPEDVLHFVGKDVQERYDEYVSHLETSELRDAGIRFDDWRVDSLTGPWHGTACGMDLEVWRMNYSFHTTTPEAAENLLVAFSEFVEENWLRPTYPGATYVIFLVNDSGKLGYLTSIMYNMGGPSDNEEESAGFFSEFYPYVGQVLAQKRLVDPTALTDVDLNRNGVPETLNLVHIDDGMGRRLEIWEGDALIFAEEGYYAHIGWNALFLCTLNGEDYLLRYHPTMYQGYCTYEYQLLTLENGAEAAVQENSVAFDINFHPLMHESFDPEGIAAFMDEVNGLLEHSVQLLNTNEELLPTFEREGRLFDSLWWLDDFEPAFTRDKNKSLLENLRAYREAEEAQMFAYAPTVFPMNETEENARILLRYQDRSTQFDADCWDWSFQPPEQVAPQVIDLNGDGRDEIVVILVASHGTGCLWEELYVFDADTLEQYDTSGLNEMILQAIQSTGDGKNFYLRGAGMDVTLSKDNIREKNPDAPVADALVLGDQIRYTIQGDQVFCRLGCDASGVLLNYIGSISVPVRLTPSGAFTLGQAQYAELMDDGLAR